MDISIPSLNLIAIAPELAVLLTAVLAMVVDLFLPRQHKSRLAWLSLAGLVVAAGLAYYIWDGVDPALPWPTLQGRQDMLAADGYALFLHLVILAAAALAVLFSVEVVERTGLAQGEYYTLLLLSTAGMMLMAAATNLMTIFLALEILSVALYVLVGLNRAERRSAEAAIKYFLLGALASGFLLYGMALVYGQTGTTSLAAVRDHLVSLDGLTPLLAAGLGLMIVGLGFKVALVPFHMWTPDVYEGAPTSVTAFMSVGAKAAGLAALGRVVLVAFGPASDAWQWALAALAALTMTVGNLMALRQTNLKRMLAYSGIAQAGYLLVGLAAGAEPGTAGMLYYLFVYAFMNAAAFAVIIAVSRTADAQDRPSGQHEARHRGETLDGFAGLAGREPWLAAAMAVFMLSLAGIPPLSGFLGKLYVFGAAVQADLTWLAVVGVVNSVVAAYYYLRVIAAMYMTEGDGARGPVCPALVAGVALAAVVVVALGLWPGPIVDLARAAAAALLGG